MSRNKLIRFAEMATFPNVIQPKINDFTYISTQYKGKWHENIFLNKNPIVLELGCGKGEYTVELAQNYPHKNFIGIDIKGSRMYVGAKASLHLSNVRFLRTKIELIEFFFEKGEVEEIWLTFPDPQPKKRWTKKRLTSSFFLNKYCNILHHNGIIHLKTDNQFLYHYTLELLRHNAVEVIHHTNDLYNSSIISPILSIRTYYEQQFLNQGLPICYCCWKNPLHLLEEIDDETFEEIEKQYHRSIV
ncbi:MAG: tRNA (guanosine(46)-N7)-methyltransferase TrmB [Bacteroidales bacterium]|nr:tRNA (guanosine(46)-N7)-methyltransferase TrmB [Bacteroidales bacterium]